MTKLEILGKQLARAVKYYQYIESKPELHYMQTSKSLGELLFGCKNKHRAEHYVYDVMSRLFKHVKTL